MEIEQYITRLEVGSLKENENKIQDLKLQQSEVLILKNFHDTYLDAGKRGSLDAYIKLRGYRQIFMVFGGYAGFVTAMKEAGYQKGFIGRKKKEWQKLFKKED